MMSLSERRSFYVRGNLKKSDQNPIVLYWTYYIQEVPIDHWDSKALNHSQLFKYSVTKGYLNATKFFFGKLKKQLRSRMIANSFCIHFKELYKPHCIIKDHLAIACFLISEIRPNYPAIYNFDMLHLICLHFLEWPRQKYFMAVVNRMRHYLFERRFGDLLERIFERDHGDFKDYDYKKLFMEFWLQSPLKSKAYVAESRIGFGIFMKFVKKYFEFLFVENAFALKAKFRGVVLQQEIPENIPHFEKGNVEFFKFLVRERVTTRTSIDRFLHQRFVSFPYAEFGIPFFDGRTSLGELMYLIDSISGTV
ncbi:hypothetical protein HNY73_017765 [Argiope bruennichi]|uniref:Uncharacterized protein n=2 Tax=Argiope bruennichi TaxID=94029 RepID=A0A8T0EB19_ARGBR|nr:hypothetical protein HNY73_017765 [Argiope bruennichi]